MTPYSSLLPLSGSQHQLSIGGNFTHPHWMAFLFSGLSASGVSVVSGRAAQSGLDWEAQWILDFKNSRVLPQALDYLAIAAQKPALGSAPAPPQISRFTMGRRSDQSLELWLYGPDQIGFLGGILGRLSLLMLFPIEVDVSTKSGQIQDYLVLRGIGGLAPSDGALQSLQILLQSSVRA